MADTPFGTELIITPDVGQDPWTDLTGRPCVEGQLARIGMLRDGMSSGRASVALVVELEDGTVVLAQTSWRLFRIAAQALMATPVAAEEPLDD